MTHEGIIFPSTAETFKEQGLTIFFQNNWFIMPLEFMKPLLKQNYWYDGAGVTLIVFHLKTAPSELLS